METSVNLRPYRRHMRDRRFRASGTAQMGVQLVRAICSGIAAGSIAFSAMLASASFAQESAGPNAVAWLAGDCQRLVLAGRDVSPACEGEVQNTVYRTGRRTGFTFSTPNLVVTFTGRDTPARGDHASSQLDKIIFTRIGGMSPRAREVRATGQCLYSNPHAGRSYVRCSARTAAGAFIAMFQSNGRPPEIWRDPD